MTIRTSQAGLAVAVLSAATFGTSGTFASSLIAAGWSPAAAVSARIAVAALLLTVPALIQLRGRWRALLHQLPSAMQFVGGAFIFTGVALVRIDELHDDGPDAAGRPSGQANAVGCLSGQENAVGCLSGREDDVDPPVRAQQPDATVSA